MAEDADLTAEKFADEVAAMDPGPPHIRRRRQRDTPEDDPTQLCHILFEGILDRRILPALDRDRRNELLAVHLNREDALKDLGVSTTSSHPAC